MLTGVAELFRKACAKVLAWLLIFAIVISGLPADAAPKYRTEASAGFKTATARSRRDMKGLGMPGAVAGLALQPILLHEFGHEFERLHGKPIWISSENFADRFAQHLITSDLELVPGGAALAESVELTMEMFIRTAPAGTHFWQDGKQESVRRQKEYFCGLVGELRSFADARDPLLHRVRNMGLPSVIATEMRKMPEIGGMPTKQFIAELRQRQAEVRAYFDQGLTRRAQMAGIDINACKISNDWIVDHIVNVLNTNKRFQQLIKNKTLGSEAMMFKSQFASRFEFETPETMGASLVFYYLAPGANGSVSFSSAYGLLQGLGWYPDSERATVRLKYCGPGFANANMSHDKSGTIITVCYEIGEQMVEHIDVFKAADGAKPGDTSGMDNYIKRSYPQLYKKILAERRRLSGQ